MDTLTLWASSMLINGESTVHQFRALYSRISQSIITAARRYCDPSCLLVVLYSPFVDVFVIPSTPPTPTRLNCRVESRRRCDFTRRQSWLSLQFPVLLSYWDLWQVTTLMTSLLKKLSISITIHADKPQWSLFGQFPNCRPNPSAVVVS